MSSKTPLPVLKASLRRYDEALEVKSAALPELDAWYRNELRSAILLRAAKTSTKKKAQDGDSGCYMTRAELSKLMKWKLTRGKFRPRLEQLIQGNGKEEVEQITRKAFQLLGNVRGKDAAMDVNWPDLDDAKAALDILDGLKGVGPATSSAILASWAPHSLPFMSDEALALGCGLQGKPKYNVAEWKWFVEQMRARVKEQDGKNGEGLASVEDIEKAAWAHALLSSGDARRATDASNGREEEQPFKKKRRRQ